MVSQVSQIDVVEVMRQADRIATSRIFANAARSQRLLRYLVAAAVAEPPQTVKEYTLAMEVFDRQPSYDPAVDATVRVEAGRLRSRLREYYYDEGKDDSLLIELPRGAYRAIVTMREVSPGAEPATGGVSAELSAPATNGSDLSPAADPTGESAPRQRQTRMPFGWNARVSAAWAGVSLLAIGLGVGYTRWKAVQDRRSEPVIHSLAVLPLRNLSGDLRQDFFADGTTDELITELARLPNLRVVSWNSALQEKNSGKSLHQIAQELRADAVVEGSVARSGDDVRINIQLVDTRSDKHLWASSFEGRASEQLALEDAAAREIVAHTRLAVAPGTGPGSTTTRPDPIDPAAREAYLRGRNYFDKREATASTQAFQRAIDLNPNYASAYAGLALALESQAMLGEALPEVVLPKSVQAAEKALQLDPNNGDALIARGSIETTFLWDWAAALRDLTRGVSLSPNNSFGQMMMAIYLDSTGSSEEAVTHMQTAVAIDPLSFFMARHYGSTLFYARHYDEALRQLQYARALYPASAASVVRWISATYEKKGMFPEAVEYDLMDVRFGDPHADTAKLLARYRQSGWRGYWAMRLEQLQKVDNSDPCKSYEVGIAAMRAGRHDEALAALREATEQHCYWMGVARSNPVLDELRSDPRFDRILADLHLP